MSSLAHASPQDADVFLFGTEELDRLIADLDCSTLPTRPNERRAAARFSRDQVGDDFRVSLAGHPTVLVNVSATGMLIEIPRRLCPGHAMDVFIRSAGARRTLRAVVVRSHVHSLAPYPLYRAALRFEQELVLPGCAA